LIRFFEYSNSKEFLVEPNVFEYNQKMSKPVFDLIIECNSMEKLGIVMDFKAKSITIDEIILPMKSIANLTDKSKVQARSLGNKQCLSPQANQHGASNSTCSKNLRC
jgi:hypothetical protein